MDEKNQTRRTKLEERIAIGCDGIRQEKLGNSRYLWPNQRSECEPIECVGGWGWGGGGGLADVGRRLPIGCEDPQKRSERFRSKCRKDLPAFLIRLPRDRDQDRGNPVKNPMKR